LVGAGTAATIGAIAGGGHGAGIGAAVGGGLGAEAGARNNAGRDLTPAITAMSSIGPIERGRIGAENVEDTVYLGAGGMKGLR
jgi:hypothetical protein